jgi:hypothetical protein
MVPRATASKDKYMSGVTYVKRVEKSQQLHKHASSVDRFVLFNNSLSNNRTYKELKRKEKLRGF